MLCKLPATLHNVSISIVVQVTGKPPQCFTQQSYVSYRQLSTMFRSVGEAHARARVSRQLWLAFFSLVDHTAAQFTGSNQFR